MDQRRRQELKALGKAEVKRRSAELRAAMSDANPLEPGDPGWSANHRRGTERERWLRDKLPVLHKKDVAAMFTVWDQRDQWVAHVGLYLQCETCGSVVPSALPRRWFYWAGCACGNVRWRCILGWRRVAVRDRGALVAVKLIGKG